MTFGIIGNIAKPLVKDVLEKIVLYFEEKGLKYLIREDLAKWYNGLVGNKKLRLESIGKESEFLTQVDILIALGGDGTILSAAHFVADSGVPILGINIGKLGFLAEVSVEELESCLESILNNKYYLEERMILKAICQTDGRVLSCLNDIVIDKGASARVIDIETYVNDDYLVTYSADGIIVATPTGSTAYTLATGGPIVVPDSNVIMINPLAPHSLTARPVIVPEESIIRIVVKGGVKPVHITSDGQVEGFYNIPAEFIIQKASYVLKLVKNKKRNYYDLLRKKLLWGSDIRTATNK